MAVSIALHIGVFGLLKPGFPVHGGAGHAALTVQLALPVKQAVSVAAVSEVQPPPAVDTQPAPPAAPGAVSAPTAGDEPATQPAPPQEGRYFFSSEVDVRARPVYLEPLIYPEQAFRSKIDGHVRLLAYINEFGMIDAVDVVESDPPGVFEEAALKALLASKFQPAMKAGWNVKSQKLIEINLDPNKN